MNRLAALAVVMMVVACTQSGDGFVQDPSTGPDPIITTPINSRFVGEAKASDGGTEKFYNFELDFKENTGGRLIGYASIRNTLATNPKDALEIQFYQDGQRDNADVTINLRVSGESPWVIKLKGKLNLQGDIIMPKTSQRLGGIFGKTLVTEAFTLVRKGPSTLSFWPKIETYFAGK
jgi:hypothetical protein